MPQVSVARLFEDNADALKLTWISGPRDPSPFLDSTEINQASQGLIGHLNLVHPNWIQIFSRTEAAYFAALGENEQRDALARLAGSGLVCIILSEQEKSPAALAEFAASRNIPLLSSPLHSLQIIWVVRTYLGRALAEFVTRHGVFLDVLGMGVLITGASGVGKSELALELISRGSGLIADDVIEFYRIGPETVEGRCPPLLKDFLEVRGLGVLNIRTVFGEAALRPRKNVKLIVHLEKPGPDHAPIERLPLRPGYEDIMGVSICKVTIPVAAGRNLAVLTEAAVRNYVLQLRGVDSTSEFVARQATELRNNGES